MKKRTDRSNVSFLSIAIIAVAILAVAACAPVTLGDPADEGGNESDNGGTTELADGGELSGTYDSDLTLAEDTLYTVTGTVTMRAILTIEPGAVLEFEAGTYLNIDTAGRIRAIGTADRPIVFRGTAATPGHWRGVLVKSSDVLNRLEYVEIDHAGSAAIGGQVGSIVVDGFSQGALAVVHTTLENGLGDGLIVEDGATLLEFSTNTFADLEDAPVRIVPDEISKLDTASTFDASNGDNRVQVDRFGEVTVDATWPDPGIPYAVVDQLTVSAALTLEPGVRLEFDDSVRMRIDGSGAIIADASGAAQIVFTGSSATAGWWRGIQIDSDDTRNIMDNVEVSYSGELDGMSGSEEANVYLYGGLENARLILRNALIANGAAHGVAYDSNATVSDGTNTAPAALTGVTFSNIGDDLVGFSDFAEL